MKYFYYLCFVVFAFAARTPDASAQSCPLACNDLVIVALGPNCTALVTPDMILESPGANCPYSVTIFNANNEPIGNMVDGDYIGQTLTVRVYLNGNSCWGEISVIDGQPPTVDCVPTVTASCAEESQQGVPTFLVDDNCDPDPEIEIISDDVNGQNCSSPYTSIRTITYRAVDASGNESLTCTQTIQYEREDLSSVMFPPNRDGISLPAFQCSDPSWDGNNNGYPDPEEAGVPTVDGAPIYPNMVCDFWTSFTDTEIPLCGGGIKVLRKWEIFDECDASASVTSTQVIKVEDQSSPNIHCPSDITVSGGSDCDAVVTLPEPVIGGGCSGTGSYTVTVNGGVVTENNGLYVVSGLTPGVYTATYTATNPCGGNPSSCTMKITVTSGGGGGPVAICDQNTVVALGSDGTGRIYASTFNDGSYSNCGDVTDIKVRRMSKGWCPDGVVDDTKFRDFVEFCCEDIASSPVTIVLRIFDGSGAWNECMVHVEVQDKLPPTIYCPPDVTLDCDYPLDVWDLSDFGDVVDHPSKRKPIHIYNSHYPNGFVGYDGYAKDNCDELYITEHVEDFTNCGGGYIKRTFTAEDWGGRKSSCVQKIYVKPGNKFNCSAIDWPDDVELNSCGSFETDPDNTGRPKFPNAGCGNLIATSYTDQVFPVVEGFCFKILRKWKALDWCAHDKGKKLKICEYTQVIKVVDSDPPVFEQGCDDITICTAEANGCKGRVQLEPVVSDCTPKQHLKFDYFIDLFDDNPGGKWDGGGSVGFVDQYFPYGTHRILWRVRDGCGNIQTCSYLFTVEDCKKPSPVCIHGITTAVMPSVGMIEVSAKIFDKESFDNCTSNENLKFSFSADTTQKTRVFTCDDIGRNTVQMWVTDVAGNQTYCETYLDLQDNGGHCPDTGSIVSGTIVTPSQMTVPNVDVTIDHNKLPGGQMAQTTGSDGAFEFKMFDPPTMKDITVAPESDWAMRLGVDVFDLYMMQLHILNIEKITDPDALVAADVNQDGQINGHDIVILRDLLLRNRDAFPGNHSWRFRDPSVGTSSGAGTEVPEIQESIVLNYPSEKAENCNFLAIKMGDIDQSGRIDVTGREDQTLRIALSDAAIDRDETLQMNMDWEETMEITALEIEDRERDMEMNWNFDQAFDQFSGKGMTLALFEKVERNQFELSLTADRDVTLSELLRDMTQWKVFDAEGEAYNVVFTFEKLATDMTVFPNPFRDNLNVDIQLDRATDIELHLTFPDGRQVWTGQFEGKKGANRFTINKGVFPADGVYFLQLYDREGILSSKTVVRQ